jgi:hypothetical protein
MSCGFRAVGFDQSCDAPPTAEDFDSGDAADGEVLTADGAGGATWEAGGGGGGSSITGPQGTVDTDPGDPWVNVIANETMVIEGRGGGGAFGGSFLVLDEQNLQMTGSDAINIDASGEISIDGNGVLIGSEGTLNIGATIGATLSSGGSVFVIGNDIDTPVVLITPGRVQVQGDATGTLAFYGGAGTTKQTGVAVTAAAIHAALVALGLISA